MTDRFGPTIETILNVFEELGVRPEDQEGEALWFEQLNEKLREKGIL